MSMILFLAAAMQQPCVVPPMLAGFSSPRPLQAGEGLEGGQAVRVVLAKDARPTIAPGKTPAAGTHGGAFLLKVTQAGRYRIALDGPVWVEVARGGVQRMTSVAHGHAPPCSGARKMVDFDLAPGIHLVQLSGAVGPAATVLVARL